MKTNKVLMLATFCLMIAAYGGKQEAKAENASPSADSSVAAQPQTEIPADLYGEWVYYDNPQGKWYKIEIKKEGADDKVEKIILQRGSYFEVACSYEGIFNKQNDDYKFELTTENGSDFSQVSGTFSANLSNGYLHFKPNVSIPDIVDAGKEIVFFKEQDAHIVSIDADKPNVLNLFKAVYPFTYDYTVNCANSFIVEGKSLEATEDFESHENKTVELANGYIKYLTGGIPPSAIECCLWKCTDGNYLFGLNVMGESPDILPTKEVVFFKYNQTDKTVMKVNAFDLERPEDTEWHFSLPQKGKDIKVIYLDDEYIEKSSAWLRWNGNGFDYEP